MLLCDFIEYYKINNKAIRCIIAVYYHNKLIDQNKDTIKYNIPTYRLLMFYRGAAPLGVMVQIANSNNLNDLFLTYEIPINNENVVAIMKNKNVILLKSNLLKSIISKPSDYSIDNIQKESWIFDNLNSSSIQQIIKKEPSFTFIEL